MKRVFLALAVIAGLGIAVYAATDTIQQGISGHGTPSSVSVSTSAYVNASPVGTRVVDRTALLYSNPYSNTGIMYGHIGDCSSTAIATSLYGPIEISPGSSGYILLNDDECLWLMSKATSAENIVVQGVKQRR